MRRALLRFFHLSRFRPGRVDDRDILRRSLRDRQLENSLIVHRCLRVRPADRYESRLRWTRRARLAGIAALTGFLAWVVVESAQAIGMF